MHIPTSLEKLQPVKIDAEEIKRNAWINDGILVINISDQRITWADKEYLMQLGNHIYGRRRDESTTADS